MTPLKIAFFKSPSDLRKWFAKHHLTAQELWAGYYIKWEGQYEYKNKRRIIEVSLICPTSNLDKQRGALYGILHSIKFL